jgi:hypothetical protein
MKFATQLVLSAARRRPLSAGVAALFALAAPEAFASNTWPVTNCSDHDPGSLRDVVGNVSVVSDDTVDLSKLTCSEISLTTGAITISQHNLTLQGPASHTLLIDPPSNPPVKDTLLYHTGTGTLFVENLYLALGYGHPDSTGNSRFGGCILSAGSVSLSQSRVVSCRAGQLSGGDAQGGGIRTQYNLTMFNSVISNNAAGYYAGATSSDFVAGGGASVVGNFLAKYSTIENNSAVGHYTTTNPTGLGGGVSVSGNTTIIASTVANNWASLEGGGIDVLGFSNKNVSITNSTISGNSAASAAGMLISDTPTIIRNSTIAFNRNTTNPGSGPKSAGVTFRAVFNSFTADLQSSIIANNDYKLSANKYVPDDIGVFDYTNPHNNTTYSATISGANNLVYASESSVGANGLPPDTIKGSCPLLGPLKNNGGTTKTHALSSGSPAIDVGNNTGRENYDQRSGPTPAPNPLPGPPMGYPRVSGMAADIGAYEVQQGDIIFNNSFENGGCT